MSRKFTLTLSNIHRKKVKPNYNWYQSVQFSSVQLLSRVWLFATSWTAARQASLPSTTSGVYSDSCPLSQWSRPAVSSSVVSFSCVQSFPESGSFPLSQFFTSGGQSIEVSASASVLPMNIQEWFPLRWTDWSSNAVEGTLKSLLQHHNSKASIFWHSVLFRVQFSHPYMTTGKTIALIRWTFVGKLLSLLFNKLSRLVITFLPMSEHLLISWLQPTSAVLLELKNINSATIYLPWSDGTGCRDLCFLNVEL